MPNNNNKKSQRNRGRKSRTKRVRARGEDKLVIYRQVGRFCPDRLKCKLRWTSNTYIRSVGSIPDAMNWPFRSSAYDPDPGLLTGAIPGFVELANMYNMYKVHSMKQRSEVANGETEPVVFVIWPSNFLHNANSLTKDDLAEFANNVGSKSVTLGRDSAISTKVITSVAKAISLVGPIFNTDLDWSSSTTNNPVDVFGFNYGAFKHNSSFTYPLRLVQHVTFEIEFFERRQLET